MRYWLETPISPHRPSNWLKLSGCVTRRCDIRFPGTSTAGEKRSHGYRALVPAVTLHYLQNLLEHSRQARQLVKRPPHEKQVKNENKPPAVAGTLESGDVMIRIAPLERRISTCKSIAALRNSLAMQSHHHSGRSRPLQRARRTAECDDKGALDCILRARLEALLARPAVSRLCHGRIANDFRFAAKRKTRTRRSMLFVPGANAAMSATPSSTRLMP